MGGFEEGELNKIYENLRDEWNPRANQNFIGTILKFLREQYPEFEEFKPLAHRYGLEEYPEHTLKELERLLEHQEQETLKEVLQNFSKRLREKYLKYRAMPKPKGF